MSESPSGPALCPSCRRVIAAAAPECPYCGRRTSPPAPLRSASFPGWTRSLSLSRMLVGVQLAIAVGLAILTTSRGELSLGEVLREGPPNSILVPAGALVPERLVEQQEWWRLVNHTFLHGGLLHLLMNAVVLALCGPIVEVVHGRGRFLLIYLLCGFGGAGLTSLVHYGDGSTGVGASGAVFGLLGTLAVYGHRRRDPIGSGLLHRILFFLALLAVVAITDPDERVDHWAHAGGLLSGLLLGLLFEPLDLAAARGSARGLGAPAAPGHRLALGVLAVQGLCLSVGGWKLSEVVAGPPPKDPVHSNWETYEKNLELLLFQEDLLDPTAMARDARIMDSFAEAFEQVADELEEEGEDAGWLRAFVEEQRALHGLLRSQAEAELRRAAAWELRCRMAGAPEPWTLPHRIQALPVEDPGDSASARVGVARREWLRYWMNLAVLRCEALSAAERAEAADTLDSYCELFEAALASLEELDCEAEWLRQMVAEQRALHQRLREGDASEAATLLARRMSESLWPVP